MQWNLTLSPHKTLINLQRTNGNFVVERRGKHQHNQMVKATISSGGMTGLPCVTSSEIHQEVLSSISITFLSGQHDLDLNMRRYQWIRVESHLTKWKAYIPYNFQGQKRLGC